MGDKPWYADVILLSEEIADRYHTSPEEIFHHWDAGWLARMDVVYTARKQAQIALERKNTLHKPKSNDESSW